MATPATLARHLSNNTWQRPPHLKYVDDLLIDLSFGKINRLIVTMPPRHGKSELISKYFPIWTLLNFPTQKIILTSYESSFAASWSYKAKELFKQIKPLKIDRQDYWETYEGGSMQTAGVGGAITGKGADLFIIDDPVKNNEQALSKTYREKTWDWFRSVAYTRLEPNGKIILIMTRWHEDDLAGRIIKGMTEGNETWDLINLPAIATNYDSLGRKEGEPLWKERYPIERLEEIKRQEGTLWFSALYQQSPTNAETEIIKRAWWQYYTAEPQTQIIIQSWDTAFKTNEKNDFSVCSTWGMSNNGYYLLDCFIGKLEYPELENQVKLLASKFNPSIILMEDAASGQSLIQNLQRVTRLPIKAVKVEKDKLTRVHLSAPLFEAKKVFINPNHSYALDVINQIAEFPYSAHDDVVDSCTQALNYLRNKSFTNTDGYKSNIRKPINKRFIGY